MDDARLIDWSSEVSHLLLNPRMPHDERRRLERYVIPLPAHVWLATSGSTGALKLVALSKRALLASAAAVNRHLGATADDVWCCVLPTFHVGGLGIYARAFVAGARVIGDAWEPRRFAQMNDITLASLVPAQVRDLVESGLAAPQRLRAVVVGGGALDATVYVRARELGWPLLPSYGMTEASSQVATATLQSPELRLLDHVEARAEPDGRIALKSDSLLTGYGSEDGFSDPKRDGWFVTEDLGTIDGRRVRVEGRLGDFIKIGGESVDIGRLGAVLREIAGVHAALVAVRDARLGHVIHLVVELPAEPDVVASAYDLRVHPFERARRVHQVARIPRTSLGKLMRSALAEMIGEPLE